MSDASSGQDNFVRRFFAVRVRVAYLVLVLLAVGLIAYWPSYLALAFLVVATLLGFWAALRSAKEYDRHSFEGLAAFLSCVALVLAGYWYFIERRGIPKLNVGSEIQAWPIGNNGVFVRIETTFENVGSIAYRLEDESPVRIEVGQVHPVLPVDEVSELYADFVQDERNAFGAFDIVGSDQWPLLAIVEGGVVSEIEAGETERRYFKAIVPCRENMVLAVTTVVPKQLDWFNSIFEQQDEMLYWKSQSLSEEIVGCRQ